MKKTYFEKERVNYVIASMNEDYEQAKIYMSRMQGFKNGIYQFDIVEGFRIHDQIMSAIDFADRMWKMRRKKERQN
jgi:hypothetical protein